MKIGIIGSGDAAQSLATGLLKAGHSVMVGTRDTKKKWLAEWVGTSKKKADVGSVNEAAAFGEIIVLAIAWHAAEDVLTLIRPELPGKIVIDVTNPLIFNDDEAPTLSVGYSMSGGEIVQQSLPDSHIVKTLNFISHKHMVDPQYKQGTPMMFMAGNNESAKEEVRQILKDLGWLNIVNIGTIDKARLLEPLCLLWVEYGATRQTWDHAFAVLES